ncbi:MAG TPA: GDP-mannose 4,6-dehydratase [Thermodesulfobacteriota bacterium]|nr:GDP-mannose 4,6-dehydratase [Thermodesulfobacteriota bacterium]
MTKRVLVTGGCGFIGSTLIRVLLRRGYTVTVFDNLSSGANENLPEYKGISLEVGDIEVYTSVKNAIQGHDFVIHLAARAYIPGSFKNPVEYFRTNVFGTLNMLKACLNNRVKRLILASSAEAYGSAMVTPIDESHPLNPMSPYASSKLAAEIVAQSFLRHFGLPVVIVRIFNTYGPREGLPYVIPEIIRQCVKETVIRIGNLEAERDFTYVEDMALGLALTLETKQIEGEIINLGYGQSWSISAVLDKIRRILNKDLPVIVDPSRLRPLEVAKLLADNSKAEKLMGWRPVVNLDDGLKRTVAWYIEHGNQWTYEKLLKK